MIKLLLRTLLPLLFFTSCDFNPSNKSTLAEEKDKNPGAILDRSLIDRHPDSPLIINPAQEPESVFVERMKHLSKREPLFQKDDYLGLLNEGLAKYRINEYLEAIKNFTHAIEADPEQAEAYYYRGQVFIDINNIHAAKSDFRRVTQMTADDPEAWNFLGYTQSLDGDNQSAIESFNKAIAINPNNPMYYYNRGGSLAKTDQLNAALDDFDKAIELGSETSGIFNNRANTKYLLGDYRGAISDYTRAIRLNPESYAPFANRGYSYLFIGDTLRACADWRTAEEMGHPMAKGYLQLYCK